MDKKKLAILETPLNGYMEDAYSLSVAITRESSYEWIYSNYIQLVYQNPIKYDNQPIKFFKVSFKNGYIWDAECPLLCCDTITRDMLKEINIGIIDFICKSIYNDKYVKVYLDEFYLPYTIQYRKEHYIHESFFFGYDYEKEELYGLAYVTDKAAYHFKEFTVSMDEVRQAYQVVMVESVQKERLMLMSCNREKYYEFDIKVVKNSVYEYIHSLQADQKYAEINNPNKDYIFGMNIYNELINYYKNNIKNKTVISLHIIYEHKKLMLERIKYMIENQYISYDQNIIDGFLKIINETYICKMLFLKYSRSEMNHNGERLLSCINRVKEQDKNLMEKLYLLIDKGEQGNFKEYRYSRWGLWRDVAYPLCTKLCNFFEISFNLHIINDKSQGYIRISNEECLNNYYAPFLLRIDVRKGEFCIADSYDKNEVMVEKVKCMVGCIYLIKFIVNLEKRKYCVTISDKKQLAKYENLYSDEVADKIGYINYLAAIHENSYRFAISKLECICDDGTKILL